MKALDCVAGEGPIVFVENKSHYKFITYALGSKRTE
jgi:hypothetical protein